MLNLTFIIKVRPSIKDTGPHRPTIGRIACLPVDRGFLAATLILDHFSRCPHGHARPATGKDPKKILEGLVFFRNFTIS